MATPPQAPQSYYITEAWHGLPKYVCPACGYDTLRVEQITHHQQHCTAFRAMRAMQGEPEPPEPDEEPQPVPVPVPDEPDDEPDADTEPEA